MIKRRDLERHLRARGCSVVREGARHTIWLGPLGLAAVPRHREIPHTTAKGICRGLGIPPV